MTAGAATALSAALVAAGLLVAPGPSEYLRRAGFERRSRRRILRSAAVRRPAPGARTLDADPFAVAAALELCAVCVASGMTMPAAADVMAESAPPELAAVFARAAHLLTLGADPADAWRAEADSSEPVRALVTTARRSARSGASIVGGLRELAEAERRRADDAATVAAERAGVKISGPLGLCFLPAFVVLGIVPVVVGLAGSVMRSGLL